MVVYLDFPSFQCFLLYFINSSPELIIIILTNFIHFTTIFIILIIFLVIVIILILFIFAIQIIIISIMANVILIYFKVFSLEFHCHQFPPIMAHLKFHH